MQVGVQPSARTFSGDIGYRENFAAEFRNRSSSKVDVDGGDDSSIAKCCRGTSAGQKRLVNVVMQNIAESLPVFPTEISRKRLGKCVTDCIRMAQALALDDLH